jgi:hypothetical protein
MKLSRRLRPTAAAQRLLDRIDEISKIFWETTQEG